MMNELNLLEIIELNNKEYVVTEKINYKNNNYVLLINIVDETDIIIQQKLKNNEQINLIGVEDIDTLNELLLIFQQKIQL